MNIKGAFIPCAGMGTRMGPLGKKLAKPLWPIFDKSLLKLQTTFLERFGCERFYINTHHQWEDVEREASLISNDMVCLREEKLLGSGGCFHNLKVKNSDERKVIALNSDIQIFLSCDDERRLKKDFDENDFVLVCIPVKKGGLYNEVVASDEGTFVEVSPPNMTRDYVTYSGLGMINLDKLPLIEGASGFFDTVIKKRQENCKIFVPQDHFTYFDWGTLEEYLFSLRKVVHYRQEIDFYIKNTCFDGSIETFLNRKIHFREDSTFCLSDASDLAVSVDISFKGKNYHLSV